MEALPRDIQEVPLGRQDAAPPVVIAVDETDVWGAVVASARADNISPLLFEMIREGTTCASLLAGPCWTSCTTTVSQCNETPDQAFYVHPTTGRTPLHEACLRNACTHVVKALLHANPIGAFERDLAGNYPIHLVFFGHRHNATATDMEGIVELQLLTFRDLAMVVNAEGCTPLHLACRDTMVSISLLEKLLHANPACAQALDHSQATPLHNYCAQGVIEGVKILLNAYPVGLHQINRSGWTPLHVAAHHGNVDLITYLVEAQPDAARIQCNDGKTALHILCSGVLRDVHLPAVRALSEAAPETLTMTENIHQQTPIHVACASPRPHLAVIKLLATPQAASKTDNEHYTALHHAVEVGADAEIIQHLLSVNKRAAWVVTRKQDTPLHIACNQNICNESVRYLIDTNRNALEMRNDYGFAPLHCVCRAYQPRMGIVQALLEACPSSVLVRTNGGETAIHLACSSGAFVGVLQLLTLAQNTLSGNPFTSSAPTLSLAEGTTNKIGNSPLHEACFRGASFEHIETLAKATPEWVIVCNNAGYTPLQVMCKSGRLDERVVKAFSRIRGPEVFSVVDTTGHTPLHSACREGTSVAAIRSLIRAYPDALYMKTSYGDTPLHLSCLRGAQVDVIREISFSSSELLLDTNTASQTPIGIAMDEFQAVCVQGNNGFCSVVSNYTPLQLRSFEVLATLVKLLSYGNNSHDGARGSLVKACVSLHRRDVRLDPAFIRRVIYLHPEEVKMMDEDGNYPLHIEASIPVEKMALLDGPKRSCCGGKCHARTGILENLLSIYPVATQVQNASNEFPLGLMIQNGRPWDQTFAMTLRHFPPAVHWYKGMDTCYVPQFLSKVSKECGADTLFQLIMSKPEIVRA